MIVLAGALLVFVLDKQEGRYGAPLWQFLKLGLVATVCQSIGFLCVKPELMQGADLCVVTGIRLCGTVIAFSYAVAASGQLFGSRVRKMVCLLVKNGLLRVLGYVVVQSFLLYALVNIEAAVHLF